MIRQEFDTDGYWKVIIYYDVDFNLLTPLYSELKDAGFPPKEIAFIFKQLKKGSVKGVTCSNGAYHTSIVVFNKHNTLPDYINSIVHEAEHVKQAMLRTYMIEDKGEPPAYTIGYLVERMCEGFEEVIENREDF